jgi:hypothetical protein
LVVCDRTGLPRESTVAVLDAEYVENAVVEVALLLVYDVVPTKPDSSVLLNGLNMASNDVAEIELPLASVADVAKPASQFHPAELVKTSPEAAVAATPVVKRPLQPLV